MIDVYAAVGTFSDENQPAQELARAVMRWEAVPEIPLFADNTAAGVLDRDKQLGVVKELTEIIARAVGDPAIAQRTWVLLTESPEGGWGIAGHANTQADITAAARAALSAGD